MPKTLGVTQNKSGSVLSSLLFDTAQSAPMSLSYGNVNNIIASLKAQMASLSASIVCMDRAITGLTPSDQLISGKKVKFTQATVDTILALIPEDQRAIYKAMYDKEGLVGKEESLSPFRYQSINENGFNFKYSSTGDSGSMTIYWSTDKTKIKIICKSASYTYGFNTNLTDKTSKMYIICNLSASESPSGQAMKYSSIVGMKEISGSSKKGVVLSTSHIDLSEKNTVKSFSFEGVADNDGGYISNNYISLQYVIPQQNLYIEGFDASGNLTYQKNGAMVVYGAEPAAYKTMFDSAKTDLDSLEGSSNNDKEITGSNPDIMSYSVSSVADGDYFVILDSNASEVTTAVNGFNTDSSNQYTYCDALNPHVVGLGICDKNGSLSVFIGSQTLYSSATALYASKYSALELKLGDLITISK
jgi:hypothetical protein